MAGVRRCHRRGRAVPGDLPAGRRVAVPPLRASVRAADRRGRGGHDVRRRARGVHAAAPADRRPRAVVRRARGRAQPAAVRVRLRHPHGDAGPRPAGRRDVVRRAAGRAQRRAVRPLGSGGARPGASGRPRGDGVRAGRVRARRGHAVHGRARADPVLVPRRRRRRRADEHPGRAARCARRAAGPALGAERARAGGGTGHAPAGHRAAALDRHADRRGTGDDHRGRPAGPVARRAARRGP